MLPRVISNMAGTTTHNEGTNAGHPACRSDENGTAPIGTSVQLHLVCLI